MKATQDVSIAFRGCEDALKSRSVLSRAALVALAILAATGVAHAAPVNVNGVFDIYEKQNTFPDGLNEVSVNLNNGTATTVTGLAGAIQVVFSSLTPIGNPTPVIAANGDANIKNITTGEGSDKEDVPYHDLLITAPGYSFTDLIFRSQKADDLTISAFNGANLLGTGPSIAPKNGAEEFLVLATGLTVFTSILLHSDDGFFETKGFEISGLSPVPLPPAFLLFGAGLGLMGWLKRSKRTVAMPNVA